MKIVVKLGGAALEEPGLLNRSIEAIVALVRAGHRVALVHGGGAALTRTLEQLGKSSRFRDGLRVTDAETRDVALMVLAGWLNKRLVAALAGAGQPALGLCGGDGLLFRARKIGSNGHDLGFVGEIAESNPQWLETIWQQGALPVVSSLALGSDGEYYNINADQMAAACALACRADALIFLTDVPGVWNRDQVLLARLTRPEVARLVESAAVGGGMLPKLDACLRALEGGVPRVCILGAREAHKLPAVLAARAQIGTELVAA